MAAILSYRNSTYRTEKSWSDEGRLSNVTTDQTGNTTGTKDFESGPCRGADLYLVGSEQLISNDMIKCTLKIKTEAVGLLMAQRGEEIVNQLMQRRNHI